MVNEPDEPSKTNNDKVEVKLRRGPGAKEVPIKH